MHKREQPQRQLGCAERGPHLFIERVEIEEGFLDGLSQDLAPGLNVVIGARGTGKTSLIELIRFALGVQPFQEAVARRTADQVRSVLGTGRVILTLNLAGERVVVSRSVSDATPRSAHPLPSDLVSVLSQSEIELIANDPSGRLRLLDGFVPLTPGIDDSEARIASRVRALSRQLTDLNVRCSAIQGRLDGLAPLEADLERVLAEQTALMAEVDAHQAEKDRLDELGARSEAVSVRERALNGTREQLIRWVGALEDARRIGLAISMPVGDLAETPSIQLAQQRMSASLEQIQEILASLSTAGDELAQEAAASAELYHEIAEESRALRRSLDQIVKGAGAVTARVGGLREQLAEKPDLVHELDRLGSERGQLHGERTRLLDELDDLLERRFLARSAAADLLNHELGPAIRIELVRYGSEAEYGAAIADTLRGSRLHYNQLSQVLANALSPRELVQAADGDDVDLIVEVAGIDRERASRALQAIRDDGGGEILAARLEDAVEFMLLDGADYKPSNELSTGQRCTVVLPMLLEQSARLIVIDQPEDHLDNSFIVETVVSALKSDRQGAQRLVATHNANIPVLGEADLVVALASDGRNGFVDAAGPLTDSRIVDSITTIMEGGYQAFERRAKFYGQAT